MNINPDMTYESCARSVRAVLAVKYPAGEAAMMVRIIFEQLKGYSPTDMIVRGSQPVSEFIQGEVSDVVRRLLSDEPIQYIFGSARFCGLDFKVTPAVLIPRPETEELVDMIVDDAAGRSDLRVLDIGTGSGCIAVSLARALKFATVDAIDVSGEALEVARENAATLRAKVRFIHADALKLDVPADPPYDIIVSNPPYIAERERAAMPANVLGHEPAGALFVPDSDPLLFYRAIGLYGRKALRPDGRLWFEINPLFADGLRQTLAEQGYENIDITADAQGLKRFASATSPSL